MNIEEAIKELREEPVPEGAVELVLAVLSRPKPRRRFVLFTPLAASAILLAILFWPSHKGDDVWAQAVKALRDAKVVHIRLHKQLETIDGWIKGNSIRRLSVPSGLPLGWEERYNGSELSSRNGFLWKVEKVSAHSFLPELLGGMDIGEFEGALIMLKKRRGFLINGPESRVVNGKNYRVYGIARGDIYDQAQNLHKPSPVHLISSRVLTVFVDPGSDRIARMDLSDVALPGKRPDPGAYVIDFSATVDYPEDLPDSMFDPPANGITYTDAQSKADVISLLKGELAERSVAGQKVALKALLYDGMYMYAIWDGCAADYNDPHQFKINGAVVGPPNDQRCLSSAKCLRKQSAACPYCAMGEVVSRAFSGSVKLTLPVFAPDISRPFTNQSGKVAGHHSHYVGEVTFDNVPITPISQLDFYERQFGLLNNFW